MNKKASIAVVAYTLRYGVCYIEEDVQQDWCIEYCILDSRCLHDLFHLDSLDTSGLRCGEQGNTFCLPCDILCSVWGHEAHDSFVQYWLSSTEVHTVRATVQYSARTVGGVLPYGVGTAY